MGRVKITAIKSLGDEIIQKNPERFNLDFKSNKNVLKEVRPIKSKRVRNITAGYITRKMKIAKRKEKASSAKVSLTAEM